VSHDLRAPLRAVSGFAGMLARSEADRLTDSGRKLLDRVITGALKMDRLIVDILEYSRTERATRKDTSVDIAKVAVRIAQDIAITYPHSQFTVGPMPRITADATMVQQILSNLIGNAFKFSARREDPHIEIGATEGDGAIEFYVRDNGAGFNMAYAGKLFKLFQRMHSEEEFPGSGVGLAVVKRLVECHGGHIRVESTPQVQTTFRFTLAPDVNTAARAA
jgi:light-regulated signal transduction histidine kinase (bacteriophytochrome)